MKRMNRFDRWFWKRLLSLVKPYWFSDERRQGIILLVTVLVLNGLTIALAAEFTYLNRDASNALVAKRAHELYVVLLRILLFLLAFVPVSAYEPWLRGRLTNVWREWMTRSFVEMGFAHRAFYQMIMGGTVDNPDQRISEDIASFTENALLYLTISISAIVSAIVFSTILWSVSRSLAIALFAYAGLGTWLSVAVGRRLVKINFDQQRYEADFRFGLVHVRDNVEPIYMYGGETQEISQLRRRFNDLFGNYNLLILWRRHLALVTTPYGLLIQLLPIFLLASLYFQGKIQYGQIVQSAVSFGYLQGALSVIVTNFNDLAGFATVVNRLGAYVEECEVARAAELDGGPRIETVEEDRVAFEDVTMLAPGSHKPLLNRLSVDASDLQPLLIKGRSGIGKTSLLRALAGLWQDGTGRIKRPALGQVMFLPQRPYMILGPLRDQLCYPRASRTDDAMLREVLAEVNLADLPERFGGFDAELNWSDVLSPGEQQRLAFARLLLNRPGYAFLDEATSALDGEDEERLYHRLRASGIRFISSGHRPTLLRYHRNLLELSGPDLWKVSASQEFQQTIAAAD
jgi:putative ATP-binding cassette transporter